jgi:hypothetical protein
MTHHVSNEWKIEVRRMDGAIWVRLDRGMAVVPIWFIDEVREYWTGKIADAVLREEAVVNVLGDGGGNDRKP